MYLRELNLSVDHITGAGPASIRALARAGISTVAALLCRYPRDWEDRSRKAALRDFDRFPAVCTEVEVLAQDWFGFGRMKTLKIHVDDGSARAVLVCFNRPFLEKQILVGGRYRLWGRFFYKYGEIQSTAFEIEPVSGGPSRNFGQILPVYPLSAALNQGLLRRLIRRALEQYAKPLEDELPQSIIRRDGLLPKAQAIRAIHFPQSMEELDQARRTLIYEELFYLEVLVGKRALERRNLGRDAEKPGEAPPQEAGGRGSRGRGGPPPGALSPLQNRLLERLPFSLTPGQREAVDEINRDMDGLYPASAAAQGAHAPMARLLQGDVGSGKTLVSFLAALRAVEYGGQTAIMAPTELLARQHAENAGRLLEPVGIRPAFLTGNIKASGRAQLLKALAAGEIDIVVGTHALFSRDVIYKNLRLVVVDEQHRFGVVQRSAIMAKGDHPDLLMMSATPIPRTLALTVFGDLDVSLIRDLPPGRKPVKTHLARESNEGKVYDFVRKELAAGRQAYFVYPLIEANPSKGLKDAESMAERLSQVFPPYPVALVHSKLEEEEKRETMEAFRRGDIKILAATSVVEVGVDVPNASCMVIEHAERFGLSALHQLRGRVGRGTSQSYCFLVYSDSPDPADQGGGLTGEGKTRLKVMLENNDGFVIAEEDLKLRGPGQIAGTEQSGYLSLGIADPVRDAGELARARTDAFAMLEEDPGLLKPEHRRVAQVLDRASPFSTVTL
ncbi:MAG: ATP-dependent DNA helicase RecG [Spirochaetaceae bacterium]|jgi:ATP-dependent DNA helicase RecG|nr:ATP-dependent DNA helicase RecG [Spirochaetaceae bacterium]